MLYLHKRRNGRKKQDIFTVIWMESGLQFTICICGMKTIIDIKFISWTFAIFSHIIQGKKPCSVL